MHQELELLHKIDTAIEHQHDVIHSLVTKIEHQHELLHSILRVALAIAKKHDGMSEEDKRAIIELATNVEAKIKALTDPVG